MSTGKLRERGLAVAWDPWKGVDTLLRIGVAWDPWNGKDILLGAGELEIYQGRWTQEGNLCME